MTELVATIKYNRYAPDALKRWACRLSRDGGPGHTIYCASESSARRVAKREGATRITVAP